MRVLRDYDYSVRRIRREAAVWHARLEPKRDPLRNRIDGVTAGGEYRTTFTYRRSEAPQ